MADQKRYFAIVYKDFGYVLDYYPEEWTTYFAELAATANCRIVGDFATEKEANAAVVRALTDG